jgi:C-terminal processing protease CtpA/Prc
MIFVICLEGHNKYLEGAPPMKIKPVKIAARYALAFFIALAVLGAPHLSGTVQAESPFAAGDLRADLLQIRGALEQMHPAVHGFTDKETFEHLYEKQLGRINGPMTLGEFYGIAAPLVAAVGCGHTRLATPSDYWTTAPDRFFPLGLRIFGGRAYAARSADPAGGLPAGSEITSINGRSISEILTGLKSLMSSDGSNDGFKTARINTAFPTLYALRFGFPEEFVVEAVRPGEKNAGKIRLRAVERLKIPADSSAEKRAASSGDPNLDFEILPAAGSTAVLTIRNFAYYQAVDQFKGFIDESFARIRKAGIQNLILDLRDNGGGDPFCTTHLLSYLEPKPILYFARVYPSYERFAEPIPRAAGAFEGKLYVLINSGCFSSTGHFSALLKEHKIGTLIGTETGGTYECNDATREIQIRNTRLRLFVARMTFTAAVKSLPRYRGVVPDIQAEPDLADYLSGRDTAKELALSLIAQDNGR